MKLVSGRDSTTFKDRLERAIGHLSITDRLLHLGYTNERIPGDSYFHRIIDSEGNFVGYMTAMGACEFIEKVEAERLATKQ